MIEDKLSRLAAAGIQFIPVAELSRHLLVERDGFAALVERKEAGFGNIGAAGLATARGLAPLTWREDKPYFVAKGFEQPATAEQVDQIRRFEQDLRAALAGD